MIRPVVKKPSYKHAPGTPTSRGVIVKQNTTGIRSLLLKKGDWDRVSHRHHQVVLKEVRIVELRERGILSSKQADNILAFIHNFQIKKIKEGEYHGPTWGELMITFPYLKKLIHASHSESLV